MRLTTLLSTVCAAVLALAEQRTAQVFIQPILTSAPKPVLLAEVSYDLAGLSTPAIVSYEAPELPEPASSEDQPLLVRVGLYDPKSRQWVSGTTVTSADNFSKGYAPTLVLSTDARGDVLSAACKGVRIDAGHTRDFGPSVVVLPETRGKQPELNKPVVLSATGRKMDEEVPKTFLQKYWWMIGIVAFLALGSGGGEK
jgi:hypothetical protein